MKLFKLFPSIILLVVTVAAVASADAASAASPSSPPAQNELPTSTVLDLLTPCLKDISAVSKPYQHLSYMGDKPDFTNDFVIRYGLMEVGSGFRLIYVKRLDVIVKINRNPTADGSNFITSCIVTDTVADGRTGVFFASVIDPMGQVTVANKTSMQDLSQFEFENVGADTMIFDQIEIVTPTGIVKAGAEYRNLSVAPNEKKSVIINGNQNVRVKAVRFKIVSPKVDDSQLHLRALPSQPY